LLSPTEAATIPIELMAYRSDRRGEKPVTSVVFEVTCPAMSVPTTIHGGLK
jgi:hypothetical protein